MAYRLTIWVVDSGDNTIKVEHSFYGLTRAEVETYKREHMESCEYFGPAVREGRVFEELEKIPESELPQPEDFEEEEYEELEMSGDDEMA